MFPYLAVQGCRVYLPINIPLSIPISPPFPWLLISSPLNIDQETLLAVPSSSECHTIATFPTLIFCSHITFATCHQLSHVVYLVSNLAYLLSPSLSYIAISQSGIWRTFSELNFLSNKQLKGALKNLHKTGFNDILLKNIYAKSCFWKYEMFQWLFQTSHVGPFS